MKAEALNALVQELHLGSASATRQSDAVFTAWASTATTSTKENR